jgi:hypothetical protein
MKLALYLSLFCSLSLFAAKSISDYSSEDKTEFDVGLCVVEFNASFNAKNSVSWIDDLTDCDVNRVDIVAFPELQQKYKIVVVPTIVILNEGEEKKRFQANIMMAIEATKGDIQDAVDEILMSSF